MDVLDTEGLSYYNERLMAYLKSLSWPSEQTLVTSFNGRNGDVTPQSGDYTASMVGAVPTTRTVNGKALSSDITLSASDVSALPASTSYVPTTRTVNGKALSSNITLTASDVGATTISTPVTVANGGTGGTTASSGIYNLLNSLTSRTASLVNTYATSTYLAAYYGSTGYKIPVSNLMTYINNNSSSLTVETGSYVGTGTSGSSGTARTKTLTFSIPWHILVIEGQSYSSTTSSYRHYVGIVAFREALFGIYNASDSPYIMGVSVSSEKTVTLSMPSAYDYPTGYPNLQDCNYTYWVI